MLFFCLILLETESRFVDRFGFPVFLSKAKPGMWTLMSNGDTVDRPNWTKAAATGLRKRQRALARCKRRSKTRAKRNAALAKYQARIANRRRNHMHNLSRDLVNRFGRIALEDLNVKGLARSALAKHVNDASWAQLASMIDYKAASAGVEVDGGPVGIEPGVAGRDPRIVLVDAHHTRIGMST